MAVNVLLICSAGVSLNVRYYSGLSLSVNVVQTLLGTEGVDGVSVS